VSAPFTYVAYRELLRDYQEAGYRFGSFADEAKGSVVLMRHDIDFDLGAALAMAEVEHREHVRATYFFLLTTTHYSLFCPEGRETLRQILEMGHYVGLHFDCAAYPADTGETGLAAACAREVEILETWIGQPVRIVSYHRPSAQVLTGNPSLSAPLPHTYTARFMKEMKYCSDSRGEWRFGDPRSTPEFAERKPMHILIHPIWWGGERREPAAVLHDWRVRHIEEIEQSMEANCTVYRRGAAGK
jgi:hypothetical protein